MQTEALDLQVDTKPDNNIRNAYDPRNIALAHTASALLAFAQKLEGVEDMTARVALATAAATDLVKKIGYTLD